MQNSRNKIRFILNNRTIELSDIPASLTLLDYLRLEKRLTGTKEGCAEGDCGACTILVGRILNNELKYETVNSCIRFVGSLDGCHIVTIEHLKASDGKLHPVQQAMVDHHGSQCGFCTPGFVMSLYALWMENPNPSNQSVEAALQGNLCRCTGYEPIVKAAMAISDIAHPKNDPLVIERTAILKQLSDLNDGNRVEIAHKGDLIIVPSSVQDLADACKQHPKATIVAGSTDVGLWVTKHMHDISPVIFMAHLPELNTIVVDEHQVTIGACVTYTQMQSTIAKHFPQMAGFWNRIGGEQVRNMGTIGGNIANGSPIGDTPPAMIALGARVTLRNGDVQREILLEDFFIEYGKQDREQGDFVEKLTIPLVKKDNLFAVHKISKRRDEDISALCGAFNIALDNGKITEVIIAYGGMAGTPKRAKHVEKAMLGQDWTIDTIKSAMAEFEKDFTPLSDWRASADYRALTAKNLLHRFFVEMTEGAENTVLHRDKIIEVAL